MQICLRDLNVVSENLIVANFQRNNSRAFPLALFHRRDNLPPARRDFAQFVQLSVKSSPNNSRITG